MTTQQQRKALLQAKALHESLRSLEITESANLGINLMSLMLDTAADLRTQMLRRSEAQRAIRALTAACEETKSAILLSENIDGKNAEIRSAQLVRTLADNRDYWSTQQSISAWQIIFDEASAEIELLTHKLGALKAESRRITAVLSVLGVSSME